MSNTIDTKVVEMRFDNKHFESNVSSTMSTLDKLKAKLGFDGATKGLENVSNAAKNVNMNSLGSSVETVQAKFSALQVMGVTALANITNSAVNAGKRIVSALTIDPVKTGFNEYEMKMDSVKTIVNSTGRDLEDVNKLLEELNEYSDQTIYSFKDMTQNIGKFTNAGVNLEDAVLAIKGISNEAAVSGANAQEASRAMYNFSQALSSGFVKLIDWKSIENANMATKEFKQELIDTAVELGVVTQQGDMYTTSTGKSFNATKNFNDTLQEQWMTTDVLIKTLGRYADANTDIGKKAFAAAQEVTKMTQMWDVLKETAQSGWARTWELIVGDLNAAKAIFTPLTNFFSGIIDKMSDARNRVLQIALDFATPWKNMADRLKGVTDTIKSATSVFSGTLGDFQKVVDDVWLGKYNNRGDNPDRYDLLTKAGFHPRVVQELVNLGEKSWHAGKRYQLSMEEVEAAHKKYGVTLQATTEETEDAIEKMKELAGEKLKEALLSGNFTEKEIALYDKLSKKAKISGKSIEEVSKAIEGMEQIQKLTYLRNAGYTEDEIEQYKALQKKAEEAGKSVGSLMKTSKEELALYKALEQEAARQKISVIELAEEMANTSGRDLLIESFKNFGSVLVGVGTAAKSAWIDILEPPSLEVMGIRLYGIIRSLKNFSESLRITDEAGELNENGLKIKRTFEGVFAAFDIVVTVIGGPLRIAFKLLTQLIGAFGFNILDVTAFIGDVIVSFRDWIDSVLDFTAVFEAIAKPIKNVIKDFEAWIETLKKSENLPQDIAKGIATGFSNAYKAVVNFVTKIPEYLANIPEYFSNMFNGSEALSGWMRYFEVAGQTIVELGKIILNKINEFLSARGFETISMDAIAGLVEGFKEGASTAWDAAVDMVKELVIKVKDFLGIHSPSRKFAEIGTNIIDGLAQGIKNTASRVWNAIKNVFSKIIGFIKQIDFGAVFSAVIGLGIIRATNKVADGIAGFGSMAEEIGEGVGKVLINVGRVMKGFSKVLKSIALEKTANAIKNFAIALAILVAALIALAYICGKDEFNVGEAVGVIASLAVVLGILAGAMTLISKASMSVGKDGIKLAGLTNGLVSIGLALMLVAFTVKAIGGMSPEAAEAGFKGLTNIVLVLVGLLAACKFLATPDSALTIDAAGKTILKISIAMLLLVTVAKSISKMSWGDMGKAAIGMLGLLGIISLLMRATQMVGPNAGLIGGTILKISIAMGALVLVAKMIAGMSWGDMGKAAIGMIGLVAIISTLILATKLAGPNVVKIGSTILAISTAMLLLAAVIHIIGNMEEASLKKGIGVVILFGALITALIASTNMAGANAHKAAATILAASVAVGLLALVATLLGFVKLENLAKGVVAVSVLASMVALMATACRGVQDVKNTLIVLVVAIALMTAAVIGLSFIDPAKLAVAAGSLSALIGMFSLLIFATHFLKTGEKTFKRNLTTIAVLAGVVLALAGVIALLSMCNPNSVLPTTAALSLLLLSLTGAMLILSRVKGNVAVNALKGALALTAMVVPLAVFAAALYFMPNISGAEANIKTLLPVLTFMTALLVPLTLIGALAGFTALIGVLALTAMVVPLAAFCIALNLLPDVSGAEKNVKVLIQLMAAMTALLIPLTLIGFLSVGALLGIHALTAMVVPLSAFCLALYLLPDVSGATGTVELLVGLLDSITNILIKLAPLAPLAVIGVASIYALTPLIVGFGVLAAAISGLNKLFPELETFLATGINILAQLASGLGRVIASFITGFAGEVMTILPQLGLCLSLFMINATPFITGAKMVDESVLAGVGILAGAVLALTAADLITGVLSFLQGGSSFADLGTQLSQFMLNAMPFIMGAAMITPDMMAGVKSLADTILIITAANVLEGLTSFITGGSSLETFAAQLPILGQGLAAFSASLGSFTEDQLATVNCAANAVKTLASAAAEIPNTGGLLASLVGENDLSAFAAQFPILGMGLQLFLAAIGTFTDEQVATVNCAANAVKSLASAASEVPNSGGLLASIVGENNLETFAAQFPKLGEGLRGFLDKVGTFTDEQVATVNCGANAVKTLASAASSIPNEGGWLAKIVGDNNLGTFASNFPKLGEGLAGFASKIGTFTDAQVTTVNSAVRAIKALSGLANADLKGATKHLSDFGDDLPGFGEDLGEFCSSMPSTESTSAAVSNLKKILSAVESIASANSGPLATFAENLKKIGSDAVAKFVEAFTSESAKTDLENAAKKLGDKVVDGIESKEKAIKTAGEDASKKAVSGVKTQKDEMESAGKDLGSGLVTGIDAKQTAVYNAGFRLGQKAVQGEKDGQKSKSPSKLTIQAGKWLGEGLIIGMGMMGNQVYKSGSTLGKTATDSLSSSISRISDMVGSDIDTQPTIRPVLDLSDVKSGVSTIGNMLDLDSSVGVRANVGAISASMANRQNGADNSEIVSGIKALRKDIANMPREQYNINGITYSGDSEVNDAIKTLVRYANIERRT